MIGPDIPSSWERCTARFEVQSESPGDALLGDRGSIVLSFERGFMHDLYQGLIRRYGAPNLIFAPNAGMPVSSPGLTLDPRTCAAGAWI